MAYEGRGKFNREELAKRRRGNGTVANLIHLPSMNAWVDLLSKNQNKKSDKELVEFSKQKALDWERGKNPPPKNDGEIQKQYLINRKKAHLHIIRDSDGGMMKVMHSLTNGTSPLYFNDKTLDTSRENSVLRQPLESDSAHVTMIGIQINEDGDFQFVSVKDYPNYSTEYPMEHRKPSKTHMKHDYISFMFREVDLHLKAKPNNFKNQILKNMP